MSIFLMGGGKPMMQITEHKGGVVEKPTCYRGTYNNAEHADMPPRATYAEAEEDARVFTNKRRDEVGGMCTFSSRMRPPKKRLAGTDSQPENPHG